MKKYLEESFRSYNLSKREYYLGEIPVFVLDHMPEHIDLQFVLDEIKESVPHSFLTMIESIYIGNFPELENREIQAMLKDGAIYLSSFKGEDDIQESVIVDDIIHEIGHALEAEKAHLVYGDNSIEKEYIGKKKRLMDLLFAEGEVFDKSIFFSEHEVSDFDDFLYNTIGYDRLSLIINGLFISPYSITTIREYFSNGFEEYIRGDRKHLKETSPYLFYKIEEIMHMEMYGEI